MSLAAECQVNQGEWGLKTEDISSYDARTETFKKKKKRTGVEGHGRDVTWSSSEAIGFATVGVLKAKREKKNYMQFGIQVTRRVTSS